MNHEAILHDDASQCLNCAAPAAGNFCQQCGQETVLHVPSAGEFLHEFVGHYVALEGKLWKSLGLLLFKPGRLTCEYLEGKRARYVLPLRLYLTFSIIFFAAFKFSGHEVANVGTETQPRVEAHAQEPRTADADADQAEKGNKEGHRLRNMLASIHPKLGEKADKFNALSSEEKNHQLKSAFFSYAPYAIFALMPLFALLLKLLYLGSGRRYGEHLLFALHSNAFAFLMLILLLLAPSGVPYLRAALGLWLVFYLPTAMRRVYGGTRLGTGVRWIVLMTLHATSIGLAMVGALALAIVA